MFKCLKHFNFGDDLIQCVKEPWDKQYYYKQWTRSNKKMALDKVVRYRPSCF